MGRQIIQWAADDGAVFATEDLMLAHEAGIEAQRVDRWIDAVGDWSRGESARARGMSNEADAGLAIEPIVMRCGTCFWWKRTGPGCGICKALVGRSDVPEWAWSASNSFRHENDDCGCWLST